MNNGFLSYFSMLITQLPMLVVYAVGLMTAHSYRQQMPQAANRVTWAILLLVIDATVLNFAWYWILNTMALQNVSEGQMNLVVNGVGLVRNLIHAWAFMLILGAIFPGPVQVTLPRRLVGAALGLLIGCVAGVVLGIAIGMASGTTTQDGAMAYLVVFFVLPISAVIGTVVGVIMAGVPRAVH